MADFSQRLKELRKSKKLKQTEMATFLECTSRNYQDYEYGKVYPHILAIIKLADYFNVSIDYLVGRSNDPTKHP